MDRPTCRTCRNFVPKGPQYGNCQGGLPQARVVYVHSGEAQATDEPPSVRVQTSWGKYPRMAADEPCCAHHQGLEGWWKACGHQRPEPEDNIIAFEGIG